MFRKTQLLSYQRAHFGCYKCFTSVSLAWHDRTFTVNVCFPDKQAQQYTICTCSYFAIINIGILKTLCTRRTKGAGGDIGNEGYLYIPEIQVSSKP